MNVELRQASNIVLGARKALFEDPKVTFELGEKAAVHFLFAPRWAFLKPLEVHSVYEWFTVCLRRGLRDIQLLVPTGTEQKHLLGFANMSQAAIVCFWKNGKQTCFCPVWRFDRKGEQWHVFYSEQRLDQRSFSMPEVSDQREEFQQVLLQIGDLAEEIGFPYFAKIFRSAREALCDSANVPSDYISGQVPEAFRGLYYAVDTADVFGAMGSWNDSPPCYAQDQGLQKEYEELSNRLLVQLRRNLMYVTNQCWQRNGTET